MISTVLSRPSVRLTPYQSRKTDRVPQAKINNFDHSLQFGKRKSLKPVLIAFTALFAVFSALFPAQHGQGQGPTPTRIPLYTPAPRITQTASVLPPDWNRDIPPTAVSELHFEIKDAAAEHNVPTNLLKALMTVLTRGENVRGTTHQGVMRISPDLLRKREDLFHPYVFDPTPNLMVPRDNILVAAKFLRYEYEMAGNWTNAVRNFLDPFEASQGIIDPLIRSETDIEHYTNEVVELARTFDNSCCLPR